MPELPEVERVRLSLLERLPGRRVVSVKVWRPAVVRGGGELLAGQTIGHIERHGKQLGIFAVGGASKSIPPACLCVHLGMTGSLRVVHEMAPRKTPELSPKSDHRPNDDPHVHIAWRLDDGSALLFRDPRRFGGVWAYPNLQALEQSRWNRLGDDALLIRPRTLHGCLGCTSRPLKAALLDQGVIAGLGNIYVDELLFACGLNPMMTASDLDLPQVQCLVRKMRPLLQCAIAAGGSTLRDYVDGNGQRGGFQNLHQVYGQGGEPCPRCRQTLESLVVAGRTTVFCKRCQPLSGSF